MNRPLARGRLGASLQLADITADTINPMVFGPVDPELLQGAHNAVETCLSIRRGERVALVADEESRPVAASLERALADAGAEAHCLSIESVSARPMIIAPWQVIEVLEGVDAGILCVQPREGELGARMAIVAAVERRRIRYAHMVGVTPRIMCEGMRVDYRQVDRLSQQLCDRMPRRRAHGQDAGGHRLRATFSPELAWVKTSGLINPPLVEPAGRRGLHHPASVDGWPVCDGTAGDYFNAKLRQPRPDSA